MKRHEFREYISFLKCWNYFENRLKTKMQLIVFVFFKSIRQCGTPSLLPRDFFLKIWCVWADSLIFIVWARTILNYIFMYEELITDHAHLSSNSRTSNGLIVFFYWHRCLEQCPDWSLSAQAFGKEFAPRIIQEKNLPFYSPRDCLHLVEFDPWTLKGEHATQANVFSTWANLWGFGG